MIGSRPLAFFWETEVLHFLGRWYGGGAPEFCSAVSWGANSGCLVAMRLLMGISSSLFVPNDLSNFSLFVFGGLVGWDIWRMDWSLYCLLRSGPLMLLPLDASIGRCCSWRPVRLVGVRSVGGDDVCNLTWS